MLTPGVHGHTNTLTVTSNSSADTRHVHNSHLIDLYIHASILASHITVQQHLYRGGAPPNLTMSDKPSRGEAVRLAITFRGGLLGAQG